MLHLHDDVLSPATKSSSHQRVVRSNAVDAPKCVRVRHRAPPGPFRAMGTKMPHEKILRCPSNFFPIKIAAWAEAVEGEKNATKHCHWRFIYRSHVDILASRLNSVVGTSIRQHEDIVVSPHRRHYGLLHSGVYHALGGRSEETGHQPHQTSPGTWQLCCCVPLSCYSPHGTPYSITGYSLRLHDRVSGNGKGFPKLKTGEVSGARLRPASLVRYEARA